jgi:addiction module HigA family antidote
VEKSHAKLWAIRRAGAGNYRIGISKVSAQSANFACPFSCVEMFLYTVHVKGPWCITFEFDAGDAHRVDFEQYLRSYTMGEYVAKRDRCPTCPGELLREDVIPATGKTRSEIAAPLGISRQHLYDILNERKPVSPTVAVRLGKLFGDGAGWARMQSAYDTWNAERELSDEIRRIPTIKTKMA